ncbi:MAG: asparagine synthase-related protein [Gemmatimonadaceae bacterium]
MSSLLDAMPARGSQRRLLWDNDTAALGVARPTWEDAVALGGIGIPRARDTSLVADATLYNTPELTAELRAAGAELESESAASVMLAAYLTWGPSFALRLNGDFAFALWDDRTRELIVGRDFVGRRSLFIRELSDGALVASQAAALARVSPTPVLNSPFIAAAVAGLLSGSRESAYQGVSPVPAGAVRAWNASTGWRTVAQWEPPVFRSTGAVNLREGGEELRRLLTDAVVRRCGGSRVAFYLSGGADSPAVFAVAAAARERGDLDASLQPVSVSFPVGDSAREDEHITEIARHWGAQPRWIESEGMDLFERQRERAALRDDPYAHTFEQMNRHLGLNAAGAGAGVAIDGHGVTCFSRSPTPQSPRC